MYLMANTTSVKQGGIVRAVVDEGHTVQVIGRIKYCDPNSGIKNSAGFTLRPNMLWVYVALTDVSRRIEGWVPARAVATEPDPPGSQNPDGRPFAHRTASDINGCRV